MEEAESVYVLSPPDREEMISYKPLPHQREASRRDLHHAAVKTFITAAERKSNPHLSVTSRRF